MNIQRGLIIFKQRPGEAAGNKNDFGFENAFYKGPT